MLDNYSNIKLGQRVLTGNALIARAWQGASIENHEDRECAAKDAISDILTTLFGPAGKLVEAEPVEVVRAGRRMKVDLNSEAVENATALLDAALQSYFGDAEDYTEVEVPEPDSGSQATAESLLRRVVSRGGSGPLYDEIKHFLGEFVPTDDLKDAWERYNTGGDVTQAELRGLDEQRADWALDR